MSDVISEIGTYHLYLTYKCLMTESAGDGSCQVLVVFMTDLLANS